MLGPFATGHPQVSLPAAPRLTPACGACTGPRTAVAAAFRLPLFPRALPAACLRLSRLAASFSPPGRPRDSASRSHPTRPFSSPGSPATRPEVQARLVASPSRFKFFPARSSISRHAGLGSPNACLPGRPPRGSSLPSPLLRAPPWQASLLFGLGFGVWFRGSFDFSFGSEVWDHSWLVALLALTSGEDPMGC